MWCSFLCHSKLPPPPSLFNGGVTFHVLNAPLFFSPQPMGMSIGCMFSRPAVLPLASLLLPLQHISFRAPPSFLGSEQPQPDPPHLQLCFLREDPDQGGRGREAPGSCGAGFHPHGLHQLPHAPAQFPRRGLEDHLGEGPGTTLLPHEQGSPLLRAVSKALLPRWAPGTPGASPD